MPWTNNPAESAIPSEHNLADDPLQEQDMAEPAKRSRLISRVLSPAIRLWLKSQLEHVEDLQILIEAGDRQILGGGISQVSASASKAVYQGLHLSQISIAGENIQTNLGQMLRGKAFRLLQSFPVMGKVVMSEADLNASLTAPLLANAVTEFLLTLLPQQLPHSGSASPLESTTLQNVQVNLGDNSLTFSGTLVTNDWQQPVVIRTGLAIKNGNVLKLEGFQHYSTAEEGAANSARPTSLTFPLGNDVYLETLSIHEGQLICQGRITVTP